MMCLLGSAAARVSVNALFPGVYLGDAYYSMLNNNMERRINKVRRHNQKYFTKYWCETPQPGPDALDMLFIWHRAI